MRTALATLVVSLALGHASFATLVDIPPLGIRVEQGFSVKQISDEKLANDIWCMTLSPKAEIVVSGPGYIATLLDKNGDGIMDEAVRFAETKGAMGLCFGEDGKQLLVMADGWLWEYRDDNLDRLADAPPRKILPFASGEHGGHAIRKGPDGWWWVIGGNDAKIDERHQQPKGGEKPIAGAIVRISPDFKESTIYADGFRNPYDFDFNEAGDVFTFDSDCERDYFLPWYSGCRVYHVRAGQHHGWRLPGYLRSFRVPDYMPETVPALADMGRGSPTGVMVYRGTAFPKQYQGSLFIADWTFGKIHHLSLVRRDGRYLTKPEVFLEPLGSGGFAPTDIVETKDGAMLACIGGRKTRGAIYRIEAEKGASSIPYIEPLVIEEAVPPPVLGELASIQERLGGWKLHGVGLEAFVPYTPEKNIDTLSPQERGQMSTLAEDALFLLDDRVVAEAARVLAMLEDSSPRASDRMAAAITEKSTPTSDFHFLACIARLRAPATADRCLKIAVAILALDCKLAGGDRRPKQLWSVRLNEVVKLLVERYPDLPETMLKQPGFATAGRLPLLEAFPAEFKVKAVPLYVAAVQKDDSFLWTPELIALLSEESAVRPLMRREWKNIGLRPALRKVLQVNPSAEEKELIARAEAKPVVEDPEAIARFASTLADVPWAKGDPERGEKLFNERACATCHGGTSPIGPDLVGPIARLSAADFCVDVQFASRNMAEAFRPVQITTKDGAVRIGLVSFMSADGLILQTGPGMTERIAQSDITRNEPSMRSLMPSGLLTGLEPGQLADLYAYLKSMKK